MGQSQTLPNLAGRDTERPFKRVIVLTDSTVLGLFFVQRYRFLTIDQFARVSGMQRKAASRQLRALELRGILGYYGNVGLPNFGKTPKVYFLTRKGWELLNRESDIPQELIGSHKEIHIEARWSPQMFHRLRTIDLMISAECAVRNRPHLSMVRTFLEYRRVKKGNHLTKETTDFVDHEEISENRIVPDAALIIENIETKKRALFFIEMDMATERIVSHITRDSRITLHYKLSQYDRYLKGGRYKQTYSAYGDFRSFTLLFVTIGAERVENVRREMHNLPLELANYYRFTTYEQAMGDFFSAIWKSRMHSDTTLFSLVQQRSVG